MFICMIHRWWTLLRIQQSHFRCKSCHIRYQPCIYHHSHAGCNVYHKRIPSTIQYASNHQTSSSGHPRKPRHISEPSSIRLQYTKYSLLCSESSNIYTKFISMRWTFITWMDNICVRYKVENQQIEKFANFSGLSTRISIKLQKLAFW